MPDYRIGKLGYIILYDGDEMKFGSGTQGKKLGSGPSPAFCNLRLSVARALRVSGAAELIAEVVQNADYVDFYPLDDSPEDFSSILTAKLLMTGKVIVG